MRGLLTPRRPMIRRKGIRLVDVRKGFVVAGGSNTIQMPANRHDTFLLAYLSGADEDGVISPSISGFTSLASTNTAPRPRHRLSWAINPGNTATLSVVSTTRNAAYIIQSFVGVDLDDPLSSTVGTVYETSGAGMPNPIARTPDTDNSEICIFGALLDTTVDTGYGAPSGYGGLLVQSAGESASQNVIIMSARKTLPVAAAEDPGAFTHASVAQLWGALTVAIKPKA